MTAATLFSCGSISGGRTAWLSYERDESQSLALEVAKVGGFRWPRRREKKTHNAHRVQRYRRTIALRTLGLSEQLPWAWGWIPSHTDCFRPLHLASSYGLGPLFQSRREEGRAWESLHQSPEIVVML